MIHLPARAGWMPVSWFGNGPGIPGSCFPSMASMGSMDGSMRGGNLFGGPPRPPQPFGSPDGSVHGATLAQQARTPIRIKSRVQGQG